MKKNILYYLKKFPNGYKQAAIREHLRQYKRSKRLVKANTEADALNFAFVWSQSKHGQLFWESIYYQLANGTKISDVIWPELNKNEKTN